MTNTSTPLAPSISISKASRWAGRVISGLVVAFLLFDAITKLMEEPHVIQASAELGFTVSAIPIIGAILLLCTILYVLPQTSIFGAVFLTGYLGGAVAVQLRIGHPLFSQTLFPVYFGVLVWLGLFLRDIRLRALVSRHH